MSTPVETYRGREIYRTADRTLVTSPAGHEYCVEHLGDEGQLHTEATVEACREFIDEDAALGGPRYGVRGLGSHEPNPEAATDLLEAFSSIVWRSIDKDNMEFRATISCYQMDAILAALAKAGA
jgi:hypothetical protein